MKTSTLALALLAVSAGAAGVAVSAQTPVEAASNQTWIHAGRVIAIPGQAPRGATTIVVQDGRIAAMHDGCCQSNAKPSPLVRRGLCDRSASSGIDSHRT